MAIQVKDFTFSDQSQNATTLPYAAYYMTNHGYSNLLHGASEPYIVLQVIMQSKTIEKDRVMSTSSIDYVPLALMQTQVTKNWNENLQTLKSLRKGPQRHSSVSQARKTAENHKPLRKEGVVCRTVGQVYTPGGSRYVVLWNVYDLEEDTLEQLVQIPRISLDYIEIV